MSAPLILQPPPHGVIGDQTHDPPSAARHVKKVGRSAHPSAYGISTLRFQNRSDLTMTAHRSARRPARVGLTSSIPRTGTWARSSTSTRIQTGRAGTGPLYSRRTRRDINMGPGGLQSSPSPPSRAPSHTANCYCHESRSLDSSGPLRLEATAVQASRAEGAFSSSNPTRELRVVETHDPELAGLEPPMHQIHRTQHRRNLYWKLFVDLVKPLRSKVSPPPYT